MDSKPSHDGIQVGTNFITIRGDSELGKFLNEALSQSLHQMPGCGPSLSVANLQVALQQPGNASRNDCAHRSCSKIECKANSSNKGLLGNCPTSTTDSTGIGPKWKSCVDGLNGFRVPSFHSRLLGPASPPPYVPFAHSLPRSELSSAREAKKSFAEDQNNVESILIQKSLSQNEIPSQRSNSSSEPLSSSQALMSASCIDVSELQKCVGLRNSQGVPSKASMCNSYSEISGEERLNNNPNWRRTSVSKWIEAWEKFDVEKNGRLAVAAAGAINDEYKSGTHEAKYDAIPTILSASHSRSTSCFVEALPLVDDSKAGFAERLSSCLAGASPRLANCENGSARSVESSEYAINLSHPCNISVHNVSSEVESLPCPVEAPPRSPTVKSIDTKFVEKLQAAVDSLLSDDDSDSGAVLRQVDFYRLDALETKLLKTLH